MTSAVDLYPVSDAVAMHNHPLMHLQHVSIQLVALLNCWLARGETTGRFRSVPTDKSLAINLRFVLSSFVFTFGTRESTCAASLSPGQRGRCSSRGVSVPSTEYWVTRVGPSFSCSQNTDQSRPGPVRYDAHADAGHVAHHDRGGYRRVEEERGRGVHHGGRVA